jgi:hypothetical protein
LRDSLVTLGNPNLWTPLLLTKPFHEVRLGLECHVGDDHNQLKVQSV